MTTPRRVELAPILKMLQNTVPGKARDLEELFARLQPKFQVDDDEDRILFLADSANNTITIGLKCTCRLQAHALAAGIMFAGLRTPGFKELPPHQQIPLLAPADKMLNWAVALELQQSLRQRGYDRPLDSIFEDAKPEIEEHVLIGLTDVQRRIGMLIFQVASAFVLLHELGHLQFGHRGCRGPVSLEQEKSADRFAAEWLLDDLGLNRITALVGIAVALLWITTPSVFLGPHGGDTHPEPFERLFQVLDQFINRADETEYHGVWGFVCELLFSHMTSAGFEFASEKYPQDDDPRDEVNYLIDRIANQVVL